MNPDPLHIVGFSGGIDSQATARWVLNRYPSDRVVLLNSDAGGNEHPLTTEFIATYSEQVHPVTIVTAIVADMDGRAKGKIAKLGLRPTDELAFDLLAKLKGRFPSRRMQFCTQHLKIEPQRRWVAEHYPDDEVVRYSGVRWDESQSRRERWKPTQFDEYFDCELRCPVIDWTKQMCFDYVRAAGEPINELYSLGFTRVGCAPCINSSKADILNWVKRFPEMIDKVRQWEEHVGRTFFAPCVPGMEINFIDDVVQWSKTVRGGRQMALNVLQEPARCESKFGLCE